MGWFPDPHPRNIIMYIFSIQPNFKIPFVKMVPPPPPPALVNSFVWSCGFGLVDASNVVSKLVGLWAGFRILTLALGLGVIVLKLKRENGIDILIVPGNYE